MGYSAYASCDHAGQCPLAVSCQVDHELMIRSGGHHGVVIDRYRDHLWRHGMETQYLSTSTGPLCGEPPDTPTKG